VEQSRRQRTSGPRPRLARGSPGVDAAAMVRDAHAHCHRPQRKHGVRASGCDGFRAPRVQRFALARSGWSAAKAKRRVVRKVRIFRKARRARPKRALRRSVSPHLGETRSRPGRSRAAGMQKRGCLKLKSFLRTARRHRGVNKADRL